ncbi:MAG: hypothetical protein M3O94_02725 [Actinomycetota bacterium]|nr:hypothetical protein [Actinomycetota bacterium]
MVPQSPLSITVNHRFRGPATSGNGGYTAGRLAACVLRDGLGEDVSTPVTVTLRRPPPLDEAMEARPGSTDADKDVEMWYGDQLVASASPGTFSSGAVDPVDFGSATAARSAYQGDTEHPFPGCFVCGPARHPGDGMRLMPGLIDTGRTACIWVPDPSLVTGDDRSVVGVEFGWAALDCPGGWTSDLERRPMVLGRMTAHCVSPPRVGRPHVVVGRLLGEEGRKTFTATSLYDDGQLVGRAEHTWIAVDPAAFNTRPSVTFPRPSVTFDPTIRRFPPDDALPLRDDVSPVFLEDRWPPPSRP